MPDREGKFIPSDTVKIRTYTRCPRHFVFRLAIPNSQKMSGMEYRVEQGQKGTNWGSFRNDVANDRELVLNSLRNGQPVKFEQERCDMVFL